MSILLETHDVEQCARQELHEQVAFLVSSAKKQRA